MNHLLKNFGYHNLSEILTDSLQYAITNKIMSISFTLGILATMVEDIIGLKPVVLFVFVLLILLEFAVSVKAQTYKGQKIKEVFWSQVVIKWFIYATIIGIMNIFSKHLGQVDLWGFEMNIYEWLYYSTLNVIIIQLFVSLFEKLSKLGFAESSKLFKMLKKKLDKWLELEPEEETISTQTQQLPNVQRENTFNH